MENGGSHPQCSTAILYTSRKYDESDRKTVEDEYKNIKIKEGAKLYSNAADPKMAAVR